MNRNDLTEGSILKILIRFAVPFMIANILQSLYGAVDLYIVGKYCSAVSVAAVSVGTQVTQIITSLITGLTVGGTVVIGSYVGKGDYDSVKKSIGTTLTMFFVFSIILTFGMLLFSRNILTILNTPKEALDLTLKYVNICALGCFFICEYNAISAVLRGCGDSKRPMIFIGIACFLNIILDIVFVKFLKMDVEGTALATVISQAVSMIISVIYLKKKAFVFDFKPKSFLPNKNKVKEILAVGIPVSFQELLVRISFLYIAFAINGCGFYAAPIIGIGSKYDVFAMLVSNSMASALTAITAQNMGAGKPKRARKALWLCIAFSFSVSLIFFAWAQLSPESMIGVFTNDKNIIKAGVPYFRSCSYDYLAVSFLFCLNGYLNGKKKTVWTMISTSLSAVTLRIPMTAYVTNVFPNNIGIIGMVAPIVSVITAVYTTIYVIIEKPKKEKSVS